MGGVTLANALISGYVEYERYETRDKRRSYLVVLHTTSRVDEHYIETIVFRCARGQLKWQPRWKNRPCAIASLAIPAASLPYPFS